MLFRLVIAKAIERDGGDSISFGGSQFLIEAGSSSLIHLAHIHSNWLIVYVPTPSYPVRMDEVVVAVTGLLLTSPLSKSSVLFCSLSPSLTTINDVCFGTHTHSVFFITAAAPLVV